jgi:hypothetical protein
VVWRTYIDFAVNFQLGGTSIVVSTSRCGCKQLPRGPMFDSWVPHILFPGYNKRSMLFDVLFAR